ncbi:MAG: diguanylate cyclase [Candidatus Omnitrophica bacterium]|nr:diguanylate cyclase [Candidatus Omnitrophota bacterium]
MEKVDIKVLLAVPDLKLREILVYLLKAWEYQVVILEEGQDTVEYLKKENPSLLIIDDSFENKQGLRICKKIKGDFLTAYIPTIVLIDKRQLRRDLLNIEQGVDDYLIKPPDPIDLEIRIVLALRSAAHHFNANALTRLPGNKLIERELTQRIEEKRQFSFHYIDINNFKSFNDKYGHMRGDQVIKESAAIISRSVKQNGSGDDFVGHIGGDDFVVITRLTHAEAVASQIIDDFDTKVPEFYSEVDNQAGFIVTKDRSGKIANIPLMSLSIAIVNNTREMTFSLLELTDLSTEIKKYLKGLSGSNFMVNRRTIDRGAVGRKAQEALEKFSNS